MSSVYVCICCFVLLNVFFASLVHSVLVIFTLVIQCRIT